MARAIHVKHSDCPILDDSWAIELLSPESRALVESSEDAKSVQVTPGFDASPIFALGVANLRYAEDEVERCAAQGIGQYLILGAGFDTFALRRSDLSNALKVYEIDHPDVQRLKRQRIEAARRQPATQPVFIPVDFEGASLDRALASSGYDRERPAVVSWMNTTPYLTREATVETSRQLHSMLSPESRIVLNYAADVALSAEQRSFLERLAAIVSRTQEPPRSRWKPSDFARMLEEIGFRILDHATEDDLTRRYFEDRQDGLRPGVPGRVITAVRD